MGDKPGHPFRGNQYTDVQIAAMDRMHDRAKLIEKSVHQGLEVREPVPDMAHLARENKIPAKIADVPVGGQGEFETPKGNAREYPSSYGAKYNANTGAYDYPSPEAKAAYKAGLKDLQAERAAQIDANIKAGYERTERLKKLGDGDYEKGLAMEKAANRSTPATTTPERRESKGEAWLRMSPEERRQTLLKESEAKRKATIEKRAATIAAKKAEGWKPAPRSQSSKRRESRGTLMADGTYRKGGKVVKLRERVDKSGRKTKYSTLGGKLISWKE